MKAKKSVRETVEKELPEFAAEMGQADGEILTRRLAQLAKDAEENEQAKEQDEELKIAKERVTEMTGPYKDFKKVVRMKMKYVIALLEERGSPVEKKK